jgi:glycosyltransferase involved in cell wall biosynthesis
MPINLLEAGYAGLPVVATRVGGVPEILGDPPAGVLLDRDDSPEVMAAALAPLVQSLPVRHAIGERLRDRVSSEFSGVRWRGDLAKFYERWIPDGTPIAPGG